MYSLFASQVVIFITESLLFTANIGKSIKFMNDSTDYSSPGLLTSKTDSSHTQIDILTFFPFFLIDLNILDLLGEFRAVK